MFLDGKLTFNSAIGTAQAVTTTAASSGIIDVTGAGIGNVPAMINGYPATSTALGSDYGAGDGVAIPHVRVAVTVPSTSSNTITIAVSAAPDDGTGTSGSYTILAQTRAITESSLSAGSIIDIPLPPIQYTIGEALPRFYKLTYTCSGAVATSFLSNLVLNPQQALEGGQYSNNFLAV